jgi:hypothetical protein
MSGIEQTEEIETPKLTENFAVAPAATAGHKQRHMPQVPRTFYHVNSDPNRALIESYCLVCHRFVAASPSEPNLHLMEIAHRAICRKSSDEGESKNRPKSTR